MRISRSGTWTAVIIGRVTGDGLMRVRDGAKVVAENPGPGPGRGGAVVSPAHAAAGLFSTRRNRPTWAVFPCRRSWTRSCSGLLASPNIACKRPVWQQYDHMLFCKHGGRAGVGCGCPAPAGDGEKGWPSRRMETGGTPISILTGGEARRGRGRANVGLRRGRPLAITNCLNFGNPERPEIMWQFARRCAA